MTTMKAIATATPPPRGTGIGVDAASVRAGRWRRSGSRSAGRAGVSRNETIAAATRATIRNGTVAPASREKNFTPGAASARSVPASRSSMEAGNREPSADRRHPAGQRRLRRAHRRAARSRRRSASRSRASRRGPCPRDVTAGVPTRIPDEVFGGCLSNGIWFLLTVIPISSRRCSASLPVTPARRHVDEHQVVVGAAGDDPQAALREDGRDRRRVLDRPPLVAPELLAERELERDRLAGDDVHQRPALDAREDGPVDRRGERALAGRRAP